MTDILVKADTHVPSGIRLGLEPIVIEMRTIRGDPQAYVRIDTFPHGYAFKAYGNGWETPTYGVPLIPTEKVLADARKALLRTSWGIRCKMDVIPG